MMMQKILQTCSLKHSLKKGHDLISANWTYFGQVGGSALPPFWLCTCEELIFLHKSLKLAYKFFFFVKIKHNYQKFQI